MNPISPLQTNSIAKALNSCSATTGDIMSTTERLKQDLEITVQRQQIVSYFLRDYQLSNQEVLLSPYHLTSPLISIIPIHKYSFVLFFR